MLADQTFWGLTPTAWSAIGTMTVSLVAAAALVVNVLTTRHIREDVALQVQSLDLGLKAWTFRELGQRVELDKVTGGAILIHRVRLVRVSRTSGADVDVEHGNCSPIGESLPKWLHLVERIDFHWPEEMPEFDPASDVLWFEVEFSLTRRGPHHVTRLPGIDGEPEPGSRSPGA